MRPDDILTPAAVVKGYVCVVLFAATSRDAATGGEREHSKRSHAGRESLAVGAWRNAAAAAGGDGSTVGWGCWLCRHRAAAAAGVRRQVLADALAARLAAWADRAGAGRDASAVLTDVAGSAGHGLAALRYALVGAGLAGLAAAAWSAVTALDGAVLTDFSRRAGHARAEDRRRHRPEQTVTPGHLIPSHGSTQPPARQTCVTGQVLPTHAVSMQRAQLAALSDRAGTSEPQGRRSVLWNRVGWPGRGVVVDDSVAVIVDAIALFRCSGRAAPVVCKWFRRAQTLGDAAAAGSLLVGMSHCWPPPGRSVR